MSGGVHFIFSLPDPGSRQNSSATLQQFRSVSQRNRCILISLRLKWRRENLKCPEQAAKAVQGPCPR
jgi:hypothetical protein